MKPQVITIGLGLLALAVSTAGADTLREAAGIGMGVAYTSDAKSAVFAEAGWQPNRDWRIRGRLEQGLYSREHRMGFVSFDESFERTSIGLFVDRTWPSVEGAFVSAGVLHFNEASSWVAQPQADAVYQLNGRYYSGLNLGKPEATLDYQSLVPYLGLGWNSGRTVQTGWSVTAEVGAMWGLDPKLGIHSDNPSGLALLNEDLQVEADAYVERLRAEGRFLDEVAPRISLAATYQF